MTDILEYSFLLIFSGLFSLTTFFQDIDTQTGFLDADTE